MNNKLSKVDYLLIFFFIAISGNPYICYWNLSGIVALFLIILRISTTSGGFGAVSTKLFEMKEYIFSFSILFILQLIFCQSTAVHVQLNYLFKITAAGLFYLHYKESFKVYYLNIMTFLAVVSLVLYPMVMSGFTFPSIFGSGLGRENSSLHTLILYGYNTEFNFERNAGMFWEPGNYACYLCLVPLLYIKDLKTFLSKNKIKCIILLLALLSTKSTTGFLIVGILMFVVFGKTNRFLGPVVGAIALFYLINSAVVTDKFARDLSTIDYLTLGDVYDYDGYNTENRLGAIFFLFPIFMVHPIIGNGINNEALFASMPYLLDLDHIGIGNGFMLYLCQLGLAGVLFYGISLYRRWCIPAKDKIFTLLIVFLLLQGEPLLIYPVFMGLPFLTDGEVRNTGYLFSK